MKSRDGVGNRKSAKSAKVSGRGRNAVAPAMPRQLSCVERFDKLLDWTIAQDRWYRVMWPRTWYLMGLD